MVINFIPLSICMATVVKKTFLLMVLISKMDIKTFIRLDSFLNCLIPNLLTLSTLLVPSSLKITNPALPVLSS